MKNKQRNNKRSNEKNNKRKSVGSIFIRSFIKSFFIIALISLVGLLGYRAVIYYGDGDGEEEAIVAYKEQNPEILSKASVDDISKNLIYCYNEDSGEINKLVLEIYNSNNNELAYITIPARTQFTMSDTLYRKLVLTQPYIPQVIKLSNIHKFFDRETVFDYGAFIVEDLLNTKLSYYTAIPESVYNTIFQEEKDVEIPIEVFGKDYIKFLKTLKTQEEISRYLGDIYPSLQTNLSVEEKKSYLDSYSQTSLNEINYDLLPGENQNSAYIVDQNLTSILLQSYLSE